MIDLLTEWNRDKPACHNSTFRISYFVFRIPNSVFQISNFEFRISNWQVIDHTSIICLSKKQMQSLEYSALQSHEFIDFINSHRFS
jgi:hypothetical protein